MLKEIVMDFNALQLKYLELLQFYLMITFAGFLFLELKSCYSWKHFNEFTKIGRSVVIYVGTKTQKYAEKLF